MASSTQPRGTRLLRQGKHDLKGAGQALGTAEAGLEFADWWGDLA